MSSYKTFKSIAIDTENYRRLASIGQVPDSFNAIIGRLLDEHEKAMATKTAAPFNENSEIKENVQVVLRIQEEQPQQKAGEAAIPAK
jgi:predicted CopG family antitoxin